MHAGGGIVEREKETRGYRRISELYDGWYASENISGYLNRDFVLLDAVKKHGAYGDYILMTVKDPDTDEVMHLRSGSVVVMDKVMTAVANGDVPVLVRFVKKGKYFDVE